jgi:RNA polymerase sigma-70 factor (ECF subfamily)
MGEDLDSAAEPALTLTELLAAHRERLCRIVALRMDRRLKGRIDASDVIQEAFLEATQRYEDFTRQPGQSFYLWLRFLTLQQLLIAARRHVSTQARAAGREVDLEAAVSSEISAVGLADVILDSVTSPSEAAVRLERATQLQAALETMEPLDREVLVLRHFEHLSNAEAAQALDIQPGTASQRYFRALKKLKDVLQNLGWSDTA